LRDVRKQYQRNHLLWDEKPENMPVFGTIASQFNDPGMNTLYKKVMDTLAEKAGADLKSDYTITDEMSEKIYVIPPDRTRYLSEIAENNRAYDKKAATQVEIAQKLYGIYKTIESVSGAEVFLTKSGIEVSKSTEKELVKLLLAEFDSV